MFANLLLITPVFYALLLFLTSNHLTLRVFFAGDFWFIVQPCHRGSHHALRDSASEFWVCRFWDSESQKQKHSPTEELRICCGMWLLIWLTRPKTTKFSSKFHCRQLLVSWRAERSVLFFVQVDMFYYTGLAEWAAISGISGSIKKAWENEPATLWH